MVDQCGEEISSFNDDFVPEDAWPVCPNCFEPCNPMQDYCYNCDSNETINPLASYMPFVRIRFVTGIFGKLWRRIWDRKGTSIAMRLFSLFMIICHAPIMLFVGLPILLITKIIEPQTQKNAAVEKSDE